MTEAALPSSNLPRRSDAIFNVSRLKGALGAAVPPLLFGLRLWASVCLALYIAFWLQLDTPSWAGTTAALTCQPSIGASLRKGWFRLIGTIIGAVSIVVLSACFPQDRDLFLLGLALWGAACSFVSTILRNFAAYSAALAGYTAAIIASDQLGATGGLNGQAFLLAVYRVSEIAIGIVCAGIVLGLTELGGSRRRLATLFADIVAGITAQFTRALALAGPRLPDTQEIRRDFIRRVTALDPVIDETLGESSQIRYHSLVLQRAVDGLFTAMAGWRAVANRLVRMPQEEAQQQAATILQTIAPELTHVEPNRWTDDPTGLHRSFEATVRALTALPAATPSLRLLADGAAETLAGLSHALNGLALVVADPALPASRRGGIVRLRVPDWLPAMVNAGRAIVVIAAVTIFWIVTAWPSGAMAITFAAIVVILLAPQADQAYAAAVSFTVGSFLTAVFAAITAFAVLPWLQTQTFAALCIAMGIFLVPSAAMMDQPWQKVMFTAMTANFVPILSPGNPMNYDTVQFYNSASAIVAGTSVAAMSFRLLPPLSPAFRTRRLLRLSLRDLRRLARGRMPSDWEGHIQGRLAVMPNQATPLQRAELLAALSVGIEIIQLRHITHELGLGVDLEPALTAIAQGNSAAAAAHLRRIDATLAAGEPQTQTILRARSRLLAVTEALAQHGAYFNGEQT
jgi:uncharacterized membrane protein YccC